MTVAAYTVGKICEMALQKIGAFSINDTAARGRDQAVAIDWLDAVVRHVAGTRRAFWLVPATIPITLTAGSQSYALLDAMGANAPAEGVQFPIEATVTDSTGTEWPVDILDRTEYDAVAKKSDTASKPDVIFIDRLDPPTLYVHPVLATGGSATLNLIVQRFNRQITDASQAHELRAAWDLFLIHKLASEIGAGPVRRLPDGEVEKMRDSADELLVELEAFENRQHADFPRRTVAFYDF